ncbi:MAG: hypothetical protein ACJ741_19115 [Pyrinomonadaceae bacterium]
MSWYIYLGALVELLQLAIIFLLVLRHRRLKTRLDEDLRFARRPPASITEESPYRQLGALTEDESKYEIARRA